MDAPVIDLTPLFGRGEDYRLGTVVELASAFTDIGFVFVTSREVGSESVASTKSSIALSSRAWRDSNPRPSGP